MKGFQKGNTFGNRFQKGNKIRPLKPTLGKHWKQRPESLLRLTGKDNPHYLKDRTLLKTNENKKNDVRYLDWRQNVKNRDGWLCKLKDENCKGRLESHHIFNWIDYPKLRYEIDNGITLCHFHHPRKWKDEINLSKYFLNLIKITN